MDVDLFSEYFNKSPVLYLEGRQHPIQIYYTKQPQSDYLQAALVSIFQIHQVLFDICRRESSCITKLSQSQTNTILPRLCEVHRPMSKQSAYVLGWFFLTYGHAACMQEAPPCHDILVFMTGQEEIEALARTCRDIAKHLPDGCGPMVVIPLYASLPPAQQLRVFQPAPKVDTQEISGAVQTKGQNVWTVCAAVLNKVFSFRHVTLLCTSDKTFVLYTFPELQEGHPFNQHRWDISYNLWDQIRHRHRDGKGQTLQSWWDDPDTHTHVQIQVHAKYFTRVVIITLRLVALETALHLLNKK